MSSHQYIDEFLFDRDVLTPSLHTPGQLEFEPHLDMRPEQFDNDWLTASLEPWDQMVGHEAMSGHIAATARSLNNCLANTKIDQISASVAHGGETLEDSLVWLGGAVTDAGNESGDTSVPFSLWWSTRDPPEGCGIIPDVQDSQETEPVMLQGDDPNRKATSSGSKNIMVAGENASHTKVRNRTTPTSNTGDMSFRVETKRVYICTHVGCEKKYSRMPDLRRHYRGSHLEDRRFKCRALGCQRATHGFPRRDKRDTHEKKKHIDIGDGILL